MELDRLSYAPPQLSYCCIRSDVDDDFRLARGQKSEFAYAADKAVDVITSANSQFVFFSAKFSPPLGSLTEIMNQHFLGRFDFLL